MSAFKWISNVLSTGAYITIDSQRRFYLSSETRELLRLQPYGWLIIGYDNVNKRLVVAKPDIVRATNVRPYKFDKRWYASARNFVGQAGLDVDELPNKYVYVGKDYSGIDGSFAFQLEGYDAPDGGLTAE
jgi:hypothetical protein